MRLIDADAFEKWAWSNPDIVVDGDGYVLPYAASNFAEEHTIDAVPVPCKIGDEVYGIRNYKGKAVVQKGFVSEMFFRKDMKLMIVVKFVCRGGWLENVFPTYEAAEAEIRKDGDG